MQMLQLQKGMRAQGRISVSIYQILFSIAMLHSDATQVVNIEKCRNEVLIESEPSTYWSPFNTDVIRNNVKVGHSLASVFERYGAPVETDEVKGAFEFVYRHAEVRSRLYFECAWASPKTDFFIREQLVHISAREGIVTKCQFVQRRYKSGPNLEFRPTRSNDLASAAEVVRDCGD